MEIEFDPAKEAANLRTHGVSLSLAMAILSDALRIDVIDDRFAYGEDRMVTLGMVQERVFVAVWTLRDDRHRIISVRKATKHESDRYYQEQA